jgi:3-mercaptopyruvate sulfurtransferase SseA
MVGDKGYQDRVKGLLKAELKKRNLTYKELAERLSAAGMAESEANVANKISRGGFSAAYFVQCLDVIGCKNVSID